MQSDPCLHTKEKLRQRHTRGRQHEDTGRRGPATSQGERLQKELTSQHLDLGLLGARGVRK